MLELFKLVNFLFKLPHFSFSSAFSALSRSSSCHMEKFSLEWDITVEKVLKT